MDQSLQKMSSGMHVRYSNTGFSNNLTGKNFRLVQRDGSPCLSIDMSGNTHVRNKQQNCYLDACELLEDHAKLVYMQINQRVFADFLNRAKGAGLTGKGCKVELNFAERGTLLYEVSKLEYQGTDAALDVSFHSAALANTSGA